jgi:hypothetical protein
MAYIFVSDGRAEADEYSSNRIWFDERDPADLRRALREAERRKEYIARRSRMQAAAIEGPQLPPQAED